MHLCTGRCGQNSAGQMHLAEARVHGGGAAAAAGRLIRLMLERH